jgi:flagellar biosynthesis regulator FlaF
MVEIFPWPLAVVVLAGPIALAALVLSLIHRYVVLGRGVAMDAYELAGRVAFDRSPPRLPLFPGFKTELLPFLLLMWLVLIGAWAITLQPYWWTIIPWATVTTLMLWPVGRRHGRAYLSYRTPLFIVGVLSMAYLSVTGFAMQSGLPYPVKLILFLLLPIDLTLLGLLPALRPGIGQPLKMFFRPDLLFGDGRVLCCGTLAFVLGMRYLVGHPPPEDVPVPIPKWNWWAILYAIAWGFVPLIAIRGLVKLLLRVRHIRDDKWHGWGGVILRELLLIVTILNIGFGFHHAFKGWTPFVEFHTAVHQWSWVPLLGIVLASLLLIFVRGGYKKHIGEPFIKETLGQTWIKSALFAVGIFVLMWSWMSFLDTERADIARAGYQHVGAFWEAASTDAGDATPSRVPLWPEHGFILGGMRGIFLGPWNWVGLVLLLWGLVMIVPLRVLAQHNQRHAVVAQMAAVILPSFSEQQRRRVLRKLQEALLEMRPDQRQSYLRAMNEGVATAPDEDRATLTRSFVALLIEQPADQRDRLMESMAAALAQCRQEVRVTRIADLMGCVSGLPQEKRRAFMAKMLTLLK